MVIRQIVVCLGIAVLCGCAASDPKHEIYTQSMLSYQAGAEPAYGKDSAHRTLDAEVDSEIKTVKLDEPSNQPPADYSKFFSK
ncbi:MAG: hypothetical protein ACR2QR_02090 [Woeseiaceae bacterium]